MEVIHALIHELCASCYSVVIDLAKAKRGLDRKKSLDVSVTQLLCNLQLGGDSATASLRLAAQGVQRCCDAILSACRTCLFVRSTCNCFGCIGRDDEFICKALETRYPLSS